MTSEYWPLGTPSRTGECAEPASFPPGTSGEERERLRGRRTGFEVVDDCVRASSRKFWVRAGETALPAKAAHPPLSRSLASDLEGKGHRLRNASSWNAVRETRRDIEAAGQAQGFLGSDPGAPHAWAGLSQVG